MSKKKNNEKVEMEQKRHSRNNKNKDLAAGWFSEAGLASDQLWWMGGEM